MSLEADEKRRELYFARVEKEYEREVATIWRNSLDDIRAKMSKIYEKYAVDGKLTRAQMTQYNRLSTLEADIVGIVNPAARASTKVIDKLKPIEYGEAFFRTAWAIDNATGVALKWGALDKKAIEAALGNTFLDASKRAFWFNADNRVKIAIENGLALGQSYPEMMRDLKDMINRDNFEIMRVLRTELHDSQEAGTLAGYEEAAAQGVKGKVVWMATLDGRTRDSHAAMDGATKDVDENDDTYFDGPDNERARYPGDPNLSAANRINCRCDIRYEIEGLEPGIRRSREDGIISYRTYDEWSNDRKFFK